MVAAINNDRKEEKKRIDLEVILGTIYKQVIE